jgi:hypothetical protein
MGIWGIRERDEERPVVKPSVSNWLEETANSRGIFPPTEPGSENRAFPISTKSTWFTFSLRVFNPCILTNYQESQVLLLNLRALVACLETRFLSLRQLEISPKVVESCAPGIQEG